MGIQGLLKNLKQCIQEKNLEEYRGQKAAVDTYAWLHKIIKGPSGKEIITGKDQLKYVKDCLRRVEKISKAGIDLILVFDGGVLPRKLKQQESRRKRREQNLEKGKQLLQNGVIEAGLKKMIDAIDVSPDVAYKLIEELKTRGIKFIVAPYEADAQLAYLSRKGIVDIIITEDSDLLAFGAKKILYKLDFSSLNGQEICLENIRKQKSTGFNWFSHNMFLNACIMAGCDYLSQIKGVGMKLAQKIISKNHTVKKSLAQLSQTKQIPDNYQDDFMKAVLTFRFQRVYCPLKKKCLSINEIEVQQKKKIKNTTDDLTPWCDEVLDAAGLQYLQKLPQNEDHPDWNFLGKKLNDEIAIKIAQGEINPITFEEYDYHCLNKLRYQKQISFVINKEIASSKLESQSGILKYCKPIDRKNALEYRGIKSRSISQQQYFVFTKQDRKSATCFPVADIKADIKNNKKALKFNNDSDDESEDGKDEQSIDLVSENMSSYSMVLNEKVSTYQKAESEYQSNLEEISEVMFGKLFSNEYLSAPFSF